MNSEMDAADGWDDTEQWQRHERRFATQEYFFIEMDGEPVGILARGMTAEQMRLNQLFILSQHQGKGLGEFTMRQMLAEADRLKLPVRVDVHKDNYRVRAMHLKLGFVKVGENSATSDAMIREPVCD